MKRIQVFGIMAVFAIFVIFFSSCSSEAALVLKKDDSLRISLSFSIPQALENWLANFTGASLALIDGADITKAAQKAGIQVLEAESIAGLEWSGLFQIDNLATFSQKQHSSVPKGYSGLRGSKAGSLESLGLIKYSKGSISININRDNAALLLATFPLVDEDILEALMPPALYDNPATRAQYRTMLLSLMGSRVIEAIDAANFRFLIRLPGPIIEVSGPGAIVTADRLDASFSIPVLDLLVLDKPIVVNLSWQK